MAQRMMSVLQEVFGSRFDNGFMSLSVDIKELRGSIALTQHNIPATDQGATESDR
jgi:5-carboxymethyl-2-hydroxymuconate isomerase